MKKDLEKGLDGLLSETQQQQQAAATPAEAKKERKETRTVCYNLAPELIEKVRQVSFYERKKANAIVTEALEMYFKHYKPSGNIEPPKLD